VKLLEEAREQHCEFVLRHFVQLLRHQCEPAQ
jgi:hypothetical protein